MRLSEEEKARRHKERCKRYYLANKDRIVAMQMEKRRANPDARKEHDRVYREKHAAKVKASKSAYVLANKEKVAESKRKWIQNNPEKMQAARDAWDLNNKDKKQISRENRRARERAAPGKMSSNIASRLLVLQKHKCAICHCDVSAKFELDHILPLSLGGTNDDSNIQLLCVSCNRRKGPKHPIAFMQTLGKLL